MAGTGAVLVEGPKWCGKTTTCEEHAKSILYMADPVRRDRYLAQAAVDITELLKGEQPRLIDIRPDGGTTFSQVPLSRPMTRTREAGRKTLSTPAQGGLSA